MSNSAIPPNTPLNIIPLAVARLRNYFNKGNTRVLSYRLQQLDGIARFITECENKIVKALYDDLKKPYAEVLAAEIGMTATELKLTQKNLAAWMKPQRVSTPLLAQPGTSTIYTEPLGVVLVIAPWNYPIQLTLIPLIGALAAGNCVIVKPSEVAPATSHLLAQELPNYIDYTSISIIEGGVPETTALLAEHVDHIFYTGSGDVGRIVMTAAAKNLTPITLELGGKSPCYVDQSTNLAVAARRIIWGKFSNAGQSCVAPDYILAHETIEQELLKEMRKALIEFYGEKPEQSSNYGRIINSHHYQRLMQLIPGSGDLYVGGNSNEKDCYIEPTILHNIPANAPIMTNEIFGPILPVLKIKNIDEAINFINHRPKPLSIYVFSSSNEQYKSIIERTSSGSVVINYPLLQLTIPELPFGGIGASGMGIYHGKASYDTFSHQKSILNKPTWFNPSILYPPYSTRYTQLIRWLMLGSLK